MHRKDVGTLGELIVATECFKNGCKVFTDVGDNCSFDLVVTPNEIDLYRVQVKAKTRRESHPDRTQFHFHTVARDGSMLYYDPAMLDYIALVDLETHRIAWVDYKKNHQTKTMTLCHDTAVKLSAAGNADYFENYVEFPFH